MESARCAVDGCEKKVEVRLVRAQTYVCVQERHFCAAHATEVLDEITHGFASSGHLTERTLEACAVDIELVVCDGREGENCQFFLHEINGPRRLAFYVGRFEAWMLTWELKHDATASMGTHQAMASTIRALGADLRKVTINDVSEGQRYHAQLHMYRGESPVVMDVRPSDAIILAVVCNIPVWVETLVWQKTSC